MPVKGISRVKRNLRIKLQEIDSGRTNAAVYAVLSQGAAAAAVRTPIDTSNLINSQYAPQISHSAGRTSGTVGYTASYASAVHDAPGKLAGQPRANGNGNYWDPNAEPGFLTKGFEQIKPAIPRILRAVYARRGS
ncbi:hypothetical protein [Castellaniella sp.]|uniref:hypothetical protein n=1 Tax=Castellaniella sp. TaxID=1955812 RepID=UPI002AFEEDDB|nr:hypothetical protein [Castellaniella sp.]